MGLFRAASDAVRGVLADQWRDFYTVPAGLKPTAALFPAVKQGTSFGRGSNTNGSPDVITNGSKFAVPQGYGLILMQDGAFTGFVAEPGSYEWNSEALDSQSVFAASDLVSPLVNGVWERFKFGGRPTAQQRAYFVSLKELSNNKFGTTSEIYWDDAYLNAQVGAVTRGTYTLRISDPLSIVHSFVPAKYMQGWSVFDFTDLYNDAAAQLFNEVVGSLAAALSAYTNDPGKGNRITRIQQDSIGFGRTLSEMVERNYRWMSERGLEIVSTSIMSIEYDEASRELLKTVQRADALSGARGNSNLQASVSAGLQSAGGASGAAGIIGLGVANASIGLGALQQPTQAASSPLAEDDEMAKLLKFKQMLDAGLITQDDYNAAKAKVLGL